MRTTDILERVEEAIDKLLRDDIELLRRGLQERALSNRLADYLRPLFPDLYVDAEYNGDLDKPNDRKALEIARGRMNEIGRKAHENHNYQLTPDIIVHSRGNNTNNLIVIEVKKDSSPEKDKEYDLIKLEHLTINYLGNHYNYKIGIAIILGTNNNAGRYDMKFFQNGIPTKRERLEE